MNTQINPFDDLSPADQFIENSEMIFGRTDTLGPIGYLLTDGSPVFFTQRFTDLPSSGKTSLFPLFRDDPAKAFSFSQRLEFIRWHLLPSQPTRLVMRVVYAPMNNWTAPDVEFNLPQDDLWPRVRSIHRAGVNSLHLGRKERAKSPWIGNLRSHFRRGLPHGKN